VQAGAGRHVESQLPSGGRRQANTSNWRETPRRGLVCMCCRSRRCPDNQQPTLMYSRIMARVRASMSEGWSPTGTRVMPGRSTSVMVLQSGKANKVAM